MTGITAHFEENLKNAEVRKNCQKIFNVYSRYNIFFMKKYIPLVLLLSVICQLVSAQNVGIGTTTPNTSALLQINTGSSTTKGILVTGTYNAASTVPDLGAGSRMMFYPGKAAFRAGYVNGTQWDNTNVGFFSTAIGVNTTASGNTSTAMGSNSIASGNNSTAMGGFTVADGASSTAMGGGSTAGGIYSTAMGLNTIAKGYASTVIGMYNDSILFNNEGFLEIYPTSPLFIIGNGSDFGRSNAMVVLQNGNTGIGVSAPISTLHVKGTAKFFSGGNTHTGNFYNGNSNVNGIELVNAGNDAYIGVQRSSGFGLHISKPLGYANGGLVGFIVNTAVVGSITTNGTTTSFNTTSDERLKENITTTQYGLSTLVKLNVKDYNYILDDKKSLQTGLLAQELYAVYPQAVQAGGADPSTNPWMVDYSKLTAVLVKAVQELSEENSSLKPVLSAQTNEILLLKNELEQIKLLLKKRHL